MEITLALVIKQIVIAVVVSIGIAAVYRCSIIAVSVLLRGFIEGTGDWPLEDK